MRATVGALCLLVALLSSMLTAIAGSQPAQAAPAPCTVDARLVNSCRPWLGTTASGYPQAGNKLSQLQYAEQRMGRQVDVAHTYHPAGDNALSAADLYYATRPGTLLFTNWQPTMNWSTADGSDATENAQIDQMAASIRSLGETRIMLALFHEPENDLTVAPAGCTGLTMKGTSGTADQYRAMWANVRARFDAAGVHNVVWVMDYMNYAPFNCMVDALYPGDALVDWVVFNAYQHNDTDVSFPDRTSNLYSLLTSHSSAAHDYLSKPWGIAEWGINNSTQASAYAYYASARATVEAGTFPQLKLFMNFDSLDYGTSDGSYRVAYDAAGAFDQAEQDAFKLFAGSSAFTGGWTIQDVVAPPPPSDVTGAVVDGHPTVSWSAAAAVDGVTSYQVLRDGTTVGTTGGLTWSDPSAPQGRASTYTVRAVDAAGNVSPDSAAVTLDLPDTTPPAAPSGLVASVVGGSVVLSWTAATDNVGVSSYVVLRNGAQVGTATRTTWTDPATPSTAVDFTVRAVDAAGNESADSNDVTVAVAEPRLDVVRSGAGTGSVSSSPAGIACGASCSASFPSGTSVTLTAAPAAGSTFTGWSGACSGSAATCTVSMTASSTVTATFGPVTTTYEETSASLNGWMPQSDASSSGGAYRSTTVPGDAATFGFTGTGVTWMTRRGPASGNATVYIDGVSKGTVDLYAAASGSWSTSFTGLRSAAHTIKVVTAGTRNTASTGNAVAVDGFQVGAATTQETAPAVTFDGWTGASSSTADGGAYRSATASSATASLTFTGTAVDWVTATGPSYGRAGVTIDGVAKGTVDLYASTQHSRVAKTFAGLAGGSHTIKVQVLGTRSTASSGTRVVVDAFVTR